MDLFGLHLVRPLWLLALLPIIALFVISLYQRYKSIEWHGVVDEILYEHLLRSSSSARLPLGLLLAGWIIATVALAGPAWKQLPLPLELQQQAMVLVLDLSRSMYSKDIAPSRLERGRNKLNDVLDRRKEGLTALVVYAGDAFTIAPLTDDTETIRNLLRSLSPKLIPDNARGSNPAAAAEEARELLLNGGAQQGQLLWITDGIRAADLDAIADYIDDDFIRLSILGIGTRTGAPIVLPNGDFVRNGAGQPVLAPLETGPLRKLAAQYGGRYQTITLDDSDLDYLLASGDIAASRREVDRELVQWQEEGPWLVLLVLLPLAMTAFRRGWLLILLLGFGAMGYAPPGQAFGWKDLWRRSDQQAAQLLDKGEYDRASEIFSDSDWKATALYRGEQFEEALALWPAEGDASNLFNRGNALAYSGQLQEAIKAYEAALEIDPAMDKAQYNLELIQDILSGARRQPGPPAPGEQGEQQQGQEQEGQEQQEGQQQQGQQSDQTAQEQSDQEQQQQNSSSPSDEPQEPDDSYLQEQAERARAEEEEQQSAAGEQQDGESEEDQTAGSEQQESENQDGGADGKEGEEEEANEKPETPQDLAQWLEESGEADPAEEQKQAMEMWLRQIPDDPSGLLRRKLRSQQLQRQQRGESRVNKASPGL